MDTSLGTRLELLISRLGVKQKDFADKAGFTQAYISMILSGTKTNPSQRFFDAIGHAFYVNPGWLRTGEGEMFYRTSTEKLQRIVHLFNDLPPKFQDYVMAQVEQLLSVAQTAGA